LAFNDEFEDLIVYLDTFRREMPYDWFYSMVIHDRHRVSYWVLRQLNMWGKEAMARGTAKKPAAKKPAGAAWTTFVEISLADYKLEQIEQAFGDPEKVFEAVESMARDGYRISLSYNEQNDAIIASVTCKDDASPNAGCTYTSFAGDWLSALRVAAFKHYVVAAQVWVGDDGTVTRPLFG
jgi:hypothetical protein